MKSFRNYMTNPTTVASLATVLLLSSCSTSNEQDLTHWVDPLIGTGGHGHVFVGASVPHGMVQLGPNNLTKGWDWCSGYHDSDSTVVGFAHTHLSGTGIADLGDLSFMPVAGEAPIVPADSIDYLSGYVSTFRRQSQIVEPGYYAVLLDKYAIQAELTATERVGLHRYFYPRGAERQVIVDLNEAVQSLMFRKGTLDSRLMLLDDSTLVGYRRSNEWAQDHRVYFAARFSEPVRSRLFYADDQELSADSVRGENLKVRLRFGEEPRALELKVAVSYTSEQGALRNLQAETPDWAFDRRRSEAKRKWNEALSSVVIEAKADSVKRIFYTALYHTMISPSLFADVDGTYRGADGAIRRADEFTPYTVFSLWDTHRGVHPWYTLFDGREADYVNSLLAIEEQQGRMPVWHLVGNETDCMTGVHSITVAVDAALKGVPGVDPNRVYEAVSKFKTYNHAGLNYVRELGYIPADREPWSVAKALEYCVNDYAVALLAKRLGKDSDYRYYLDRSRNYRRYFDPSVGFMRGKLADGSWRAPFDPFHSVHMEDDYVEGNAWQYTWMVPHDPQGLIDLFGGTEQFLHKFDSLFTVKSELNKGASIDITGMIGQYAHGNEPSHSTLYLYAQAGRPWRTAELVREVFDRFYHIGKNGLIGNEDCGQMSVWYLFSALGFYPANPVGGEYVFGSPIVDRATLRLSNGKRFRIEVKGNSRENRYIRRVLINGKEHKGISFSHQVLLEGGDMIVEMSDRPQK